MSAGFVQLLNRDQPLYQAVLLGSACAIVGLALIFGHTATHEAISQAEKADQLSSLNQVLPADLYDNNPLVESQLVDHPSLMQEATLMLARKEGEVTAVAIQGRVAGWGGPIDFIAATDRIGNVLGVRVISHKETPGLADKIEIAKSDWITSFNGKHLTDTRWAVKKDNGDFDQFTGATITPRALVKGVYAALEIQREWQQHPDSPEIENGGN